MHLNKVRSLQVGHVQKRQLSTGKMYELKTLSLRPPIFGKKAKLFITHKAETDFFPNKIYSALRLFIPFYVTFASFLKLRKS